MDEECYPAISMNSVSNGQRKYQHMNNVTGSTGSNGHSQVPTGSAAAQNPTLHHHTYAAADGDRDRDRRLSDEDSEEDDDSSLDSDMDEPMIKEEPLSPGSSCPPSPVLHGNNTRSKNKMLNNINLSQMAALTNTDLVFEHTVSELGFLLIVQN